MGEVVGCVRVGVVDIFFVWLKRGGNRFWVSVGKEVKGEVL